MSVKHKPTYKKFLKLRENISGSKKISVLRKKKWIFLKKKSTKLNKFLNNNLHQVSKTAKSFKNLYKSQLLTKQKLKLYYTKLSNKQLKILCKKAYLQSKSINKKEIFDLLFYLLENRLDVILFRANIVENITSAKQFISHGNISVNKKKVLSSNLIVKKGDLIEFHPKMNNLINDIILSKKFNFIVPHYLEVNKVTFKFYYTTNLSFEKLIGFNPFWLDIQNLNSTYNK